MNLDWNKYPNFTRSEFKCSHTDECHMDQYFMETLQQIRDTYDRPMIITSGYRHNSHPVEINKTKPGEHVYGVAADILVRGTSAMELMVIAYSYGIRRIGINQKGDHNKRFVHLGTGNKRLHFPRGLWTY